MKLPAGLYDSLITNALAQDLRDSDSSEYETLKGGLDAGDSHEAFVRHFRGVLQRALKDLPEERKVDRQAALYNRLIDVIDAELGASRNATERADNLTNPTETLLALVRRAASLPGISSIPERPAIPLSVSDLLINARGEPSLGHVLAREFASSDRVDLVCAFVRWSSRRATRRTAESFSRSCFALDRGPSTRSAWWTRGSSRPPAARPTRPSFPFRRRSTTGSTGTRSAWVTLPFDGTETFGAVRIYYQLQVSPAPVIATFNDVPTSDPAFRFIEALVASGITAGCGGGNYCPDAPVTRRQVAVFLAKALGLHWPDGSSF